MKPRSTDQQKLSLLVHTISARFINSRFVAEISKTSEESVSQVTPGNQTGFKQIPRMKGPKGEPF